MGLVVPVGFETAEAGVDVRVEDSLEYDEESDDGGDNYRQRRGAGARGCYGALCSMRSTGPEVRDMLQLSHCCAFGVSWRRHDGAALSLLDNPNLVANSLRINWKS